MYLSDKWSIESYQILFCVATAKQELSKHSKKNKKFCSTGCTDPNDESEDVTIAVSRVRLEIYWHKLLTRINNVLFRTTVQKIFEIQALIQY